MNQHVFSQVPSVKIPRSLFRRPFNLKTTLPTDYLIPIFCDECLPGDTFKFKSRLFGRLSTPLVPIMDNLYLDTFYFAVPLRLVDDNFVKIMGEKPFGELTSDFYVPQLNSGDGVAVQSLSDYLGIPINVPNLSFSAYWHRAYNLIWNEWFRDENLCAPRPIAGKHYDGTVTDEVLSDYVLLKRTKRHDYFTSCLPWPQKGLQVSVGLGNYAPVFGNGDALGLISSPTQIGVHNLAWSNSPSSGKSPLALTDVTTSRAVGDLGNVTPVWGTTSSTFPAIGVSTNPDLSGLKADLSSASSITINALRQAFAVQSLLERDSSSGSRYTELIRGHFSVVSPDARLQRPEFLGGNSQPMNVNTVPQTSATDIGNVNMSETPQGHLAAFVTCGNECTWSKSFTEHTLILGLACVRADLSYQQGLPRMFSRRSRYDFYWPELANLGEQAVLNKEIYAQGASVVNASGDIIDDEPFGYQERWAEYRYHPNMITGKFRSTLLGGLDYWHLAQKFDSLPTLSDTFILESVPISRVLALDSEAEPPVILDGWFDVRCARPMPLYSIPSIGRRL